MSTATTASIEEYLDKNVHLLPQTKQLRALHTIIRARDAKWEDFVFSSGRIIRLLIEAALDLTPFEEHRVETPVGEIYEGLRSVSPICGVSVVRAGDSMEAGLRAVCPSARIGKILIQRDKVTKLPHLYYSALPGNIATSQVLLLDPMLATGGSALAAIEVLLDRGVAVRNIVFVNLLSAPEGITAVCDRHPELTIVTSSVEKYLNHNAFMVPGIGDFGDRFFGTDT
jgi:uracil phosphoribosyltransferase